MLEGDRITMQMKKLISLGFMVLLCCCGGSSDTLDLNDALKTWTGRYTQSGLVCGGSPIFACSGCELGDIAVTVSKSGQLYSLSVSKSFDSSSKEDSAATCEYSGEGNSSLEIRATSDNTSCAREVIFTLNSKTEATFTESPRAQEDSGVCELSTFSRLTS